MNPDKGVAKGACMLRRMCMISNNNNELMLDKRKKRKLSSLCDLFVLIMSTIVWTSLIIL